MKTKTKKPANQGDFNDSSHVLRLRLPHRLYDAVTEAAGGKQHISAFARDALARAVEIPESEVKLQRGRPRKVESE